MTIPPTSELPLLKAYLLGLITLPLGAVLFGCFPLTIRGLSRLIKPWGDLFILCRGRAGIRRPPSQ
jgi:hypothetical protein